MTQDLHQRSPLAQRLQRRSLESAGVINLHPSSIELTNTTIHRMVQRELLPNQIESRYQTAGVTSSLELPGRSRVETLGRLSPNMETSRLSPMLQRSASSMSNDPTPIPIWNTSEEATIPLPSPNKFRVSRKPTSESIPIPAVNKSTTANATTATVTESTTDRERVRVQHPRDTLLPANGSETSLLMAKPLMPNSIDPTLPIDTTPVSDRLFRQIDAPSALSGDRVSRSISSLPSVSDTSNNPLPLLARFPVAESSSTSATDLGKSVATEDIPRVRVESGGVLTSPTMPISENSQPLIIAKFPVTPKSIGENNMLQAKELTSVKTSSLTLPALQQTTVMIQPLSQRQFESQPNSILRRQTVPESVDRSPLPLHTQIPVNTIVRQTEPQARSISVPTTATPPPPPPADKSAAGVEPNLNQITDRVSRLLTRQLTIERERRGIHTW